MNGITLIEHYITNDTIRRTKLTKIPLIDEPSLPSQLTLVVSVNDSLLSYLVEELRQGGTTSNSKVLRGSF
ncbi:hypothetical protein N9017_03175 [Akkermansiaceae bacterium]|nr:hypothetical protein [Akkermansiaceae bacterium]MDB4489097.1 hypothetical protein [Akkermansiaceae bacterium]